MAKFKLGALLLLQALLIVSAEGGADEESDAKQTTTSSTVSPTAAGGERETTLASRVGDASGAAEIISQIGSEKGDGEDAAQQQAANDTGASRGSGGELSGTPPKWFCPIFHQEVVPGSDHGKLLGYVVRLSDYDFLAHSQSVSRALADRPGWQCSSGSAHEPIMFNAPATINVTEGSDQHWHWFYDQVAELGSAIGLYRLRKYVVLSLERQVPIYSGVNSDPPKLQRDVRAPAENCYAQYYSYEPGKASDRFNSIRQFVRRNVKFNDCNPAGHCRVEILGGSICEAPFEAGVPIICGGFLSYIGVGSPNEEGCGSDMSAIRIADYYNKLQRTIDREEFCATKWRCFAHGLLTASNMKSSTRRAPVGRHVARKPVAATSPNVRNKQRNLRRP